jgi:hypothetical protein
MAKYICIYMYIHIPGKCFIGPAYTHERNYHHLCTRHRAMFARSDNHVDIYHFGRLEGNLRAD